MKKTIAVIAMAGLFACGCSHFRHKDNSNTGGTYDSTQMNSGSNSSTNFNNGSTSGTSSSSSSTDSGTSNPSDKTPK